jgi:Zn finger protein HypA/HybF involved in hydrogenase expression
MRSLKLPVVECHRCGARWHPRTTTIRVCARCHSAYFDVARSKRPVKSAVRLNNEGRRLTGSKRRAV